MADDKKTKVVEEKAPTKKDLENRIKADYQKGIALDDIVKKYGDDFPMKKGKVMRILGFPENEIAIYESQDQ